MFIEPRPFFSRVFYHCTNSHWETKRWKVEYRDVQVPFCAAVWMSTLWLAISFVNTKLIKLCLVVMVAVCYVETKLSTNTVSRGPPIRKHLLKSAKEARRVHLCFHRYCRPGPGASVGCVTKITCLRTPGSPLLPGERAPPPSDAQFTLWWSSDVNVARFGLNARPTSTTITTGPRPSLHSTFWILNTLGNHYQLTLKS